MPTLSSISPISGPPGTAITCTGTGYTAGSRVACPALADTTFVSGTSITAVVPAGFVGPGGASMLIDVYVENADGSKSGVQPFTVIFDYALLQSFTTVDKIASELPAFKRGGQITDATIENWARSVAQKIVSITLRRALPLDSTKWPAVTPGTAMPSPAGVLEMINRLGAAARLAAAVSAGFAQGEWGHAKSLTRDYERELGALEKGDYDNLFSPAAATADTGKVVSGGDVETDDGEAERAFSKTQIF